MAEGAQVVVGQISGVFGVRGWVRVRSFTEPPDNILRYSPWLLGDAGKERCYEVVAGRPHGRGFIARIAGIADRDKAVLLTGAAIAVPRDVLPVASADEFYWSDLEGLTVIDGTGRRLGEVDHLFATGSNDVLVVAGERERLIPFLPGQVVLDVDLTERIVRVNWDADF